MLPKAIRQRLCLCAPLGQGGGVLVGLLAFAYGWVLLTPIVPAISEAGLRRFNLVSGSFLTWALQQPVPSMYNFSNEARVSPEAIPPRLGLKQMNHYPTRLFTYTAREAYLDQLPVLVESRSTYRGHRVEVRHRVEAAEGGIRMVALSVTESDD